MNALISKNYFQVFFIERTYGWNFIVTTILISIVISSIFNDRPYRTRKGILIHLADIILTYLLCLCLSSFFFYFFGSAYLSLFVYPILILLHSFLMNGYRKSDRFSKVMTLTSFVILFFPLTSSIGVVFHMWDSVLFLVVPLFLISVFIIHRFRLDEFTKISVASIIVEIINFLIVLSVTISINFVGFANVPESFQLVLFLGLYVMTFAGAYLFYKLASEQEQAIRIRAEAFKSHNDYELIQRTNENIEDLKKMRHDMKSQYQYMQILLKKKDYAALDTFFADMMEESFVPLSFVNCGNNAISGVMNMEIHKARDQSVTIEHSILVPGKLPISDFDLARLLYNIIDNAIEGSVRDGITKPVVHVLITYNEPMLVISVRNPVDPKFSLKERMKQPTMKPDKSIHGYGSRIIQDVIRKYDGESTVDIKDGQYEFSCMLRLKEDQR